MMLYHGTTEVIGAIDFAKCRLRTDFGKGFYMSSKLGTARDWAIGKAGFSGVPTVMRYVVSNDIFADSNLTYRRFDSPTEEWLNFIRDNRRMDIGHGKASEPRHIYDLVSGPIANDKVADAVDRYCKGKISVEDAIARIKTLPSVFQLSIHTKQALEYIKPVAYSQREIGKWSIWKPLGIL